MKALSTLQLVILSGYQAFAGYFDNSMSQQTKQISSSVSTSNKKTLNLLKLTNEEATDLDGTDELFLFQITLYDGSGDDGWEELEILY